MKQTEYSEHPSSTTPLIRLAKPEKVYGSSMLKVARHFGMIHEATRILALADILQRMPEILAVGVVDEQDRARGLISREQLFALLGKPYGRDILNKRPVSDIAEHARTFNLHENLFGIAKEVQNDLSSQKVGFFILVDELDRFNGIVSTHDLLNFLSHITQEDIELAASLQERLVKGKESHHGKNWNIQAWSQYAKGVGGDFHFSRKTNENTWFFTLCDVSGKGVAASIISSMVWGMLSMFDFRLGLRELIIRINEAIITSFQLEKYLTGIFMIFDTDKRKLTVADMGHSHMVLFRGGRAHKLKSTRSNLPIGIDPTLRPALFSCTLELGDKILLFSDGITEQENASGHEFGEEKLKQTVLSVIEKKGNLSEILPAEVARFRNATPQQDDMSFMFLSLD